MNITELNLKRNDVLDLGTIDLSFYETIFRVYKVDKHYVYNILRQVTLPEGVLDEKFFSYIDVQASSPWTLVSNKAYGTIKLWWLICIVNGVYNPVYNCPPGTPVRILRPGYVRDILNTIDAT